MSLSSGVLATNATVYKHTKGNTLYVSIPSKMAQDSAFTIKEGDEVNMEFDTARGAIVITLKKAGRNAGATKGSKKGDDLGDSEKSPVKGI